MKFQSKPFLFMLSSAFMPWCVGGQQATFEPSIRAPVCVKLDTIAMQGNAEFVDTDGSGLPPSFITTGKCTAVRNHHKQFRVTSI